MTHYLALAGLSLAAITPFLLGAGGQWIFSAFVGGMPAPDTQSGKGYRWLYGSLHMLAANLDKVEATMNLPPKV